MRTYYVDAGSDRLSDIVQGRLYQGEQHIRNTDHIVEIA